MPRAAAKKTKRRATTTGKTKRTVSRKKKVVVKKLPAFREPLTKSQLLTTIADSIELSKKEVSGVLEELGNVIERHIRSRAAGQFTLPGLLKVKVVRKPATKARKGINPFTGEETVFKAKPARNVVKIRPLKKLKEMVE